MRGDVRAPVTSDASIRPSAQAAAGGAATGTAAAWTVVTQVLDQEWTFLPGTVAATVVFCVVLTFALGLLGTWRTLGEPASPYLRNE